MATANQAYFNAALRHQIDVRRFQAGEIRAAIKLLSRADRDFVAKLRERLARLGQTTDFTSRRWKTLLSDIRTLRRVAIEELKTKTAGTLREFSVSETAREAALLERAIPIEVSMATVPVEQLRAIATTEPFRGNRLQEWFETLARSDQKRLREAIQIGMVQGEGIPAIIKRVAGTKEASFADGALASTRREAEAIIRTGVNHVSNSAREEVWDANSDIISALRWTSTLDGRTTPICQARDGMMAPVGDKPLPEGAEPLDPPGARPPAHVNCRSVMVAVIDGVGVLGNRPAVRDTRRPDDRETDFRAEARRTGRPIQEIRAEWARENIGTVPAKQTYDSWLRQQPAAFQDEVLGPGRAKLFRDGSLSLDQFVDASGKELTLEALQKLA